jgi:hypothetical protein
MSLLLAVHESAFCCVDANDMTVVRHGTVGQNWDTVLQELNPIEVISDGALPVDVAMWVEKSGCVVTTRPAADDAFALACAYCRFLGLPPPAVRAPAAIGRDAARLADANCGLG